MIKKIFSIFILILFTLLIVGCNNNYNYKSDLETVIGVEVNVDNKFINKLNYINDEDNIDTLNREEIVLKYEVYEYLFRTFNISYDMYRNVYTSKMINKQNPDQKLIIGYSQDFTRFSSNIELFKAYNLIGLSLKEIEKKLIDNGYDLEAEREYLEQYGQNGFLVSISAPIQRSENDSYIYSLRRVFHITNEITEYAQYYLIRYNFREIDGIYKLSTIETIDGFTANSSSPIQNPLEPAEHSVKELEDEFIVKNNLSEIEYSIIFDIKRIDKELKEIIKDND